MHVRGISNTVATALLIVIAIALAVGIYFGAQKFTSASDFVQINAFKIQNKYAGQKQIAVLGLRLTSKADKQLTVTKIRTVLTYSDGSTETLEWDSQNGWGTSTYVSPSGPDGTTVINPGSTTELTITFTKDLSTDNKQITAVAFQVEVTDPAGNTYTFSSNEVSLT